jgi:hypothetical protein
MRETFRRISAQYAQDQANFIEQHQSQPRMGAVTPAADSSGTRFKFGAPHAIHEHDSCIKVQNRVAFGKPPVTDANFLVSCAMPQHCGNTVFENRVAYRWRKRRPDLGAGSSESRSALDTDTRSRAPTASDISISPTCRHPESGVGAAPKQFII